MIIKSILDEKGGISLAETHCGWYLVGVGYRVGQVITHMNPALDFIQTSSLAIAKHQFNIKTGA